MMRSKDFSCLVFQAFLNICYTWRLGHSSVQSFSGPPTLIRGNLAGFFFGGALFEQVDVSGSAAPKRQICNV
jgi:hypothetical protein